MNPVVIKPSSWLTQGVKTEQINHLTLFKFTDELGDRLQELLDKKKAATLTPEETAELEAIGELDTIFSYINGVIASRLKLLIRLAPEPPTVLQQLEELATEADWQEITDSMTRILLKAQYRIAQRQVIETMQIESLGSLATEDDILAAAIGLTKDV